MNLFTMERTASSFSGLCPLPPRSRAPEVSPPPPWALLHGAFSALERAICCADFLAVGMIGWSITFLMDTGHDAAGDEIFRLRMQTWRDSNTNRRNPFVNTH